MLHNSMPSVLIVDDETNLRRVISVQLEQVGIPSEQAVSAEEAIAKLRQSPFSCVISDMKMPAASGPQDGMAVLEFVRTHCPSTPLILITAYGTVDMAVQALKKGAFDFLSKPFQKEELVQIVQAARATYHLDHPHPVSRPFGSAETQRQWTGASTHFQEITQQVTKAARTPCNIIITGEMGTGKELIARAIHQSSSQKDFPFIRMHCGAVPAESLEGELFGFEKGTHPTLLSGKPGKLELSNQGTLLIEEIQLLPQSMQLRLLESIQNKTAERIGGVSPRLADVRIIATSRTPLRPSPQFREDLFLALNVMSIAILPLREHLDDLEPIARHLLKGLNVRLQKSVKDIDRDVLSEFRNYNWPGNVRELENVLERAVVKCSGLSLRLSDLPEDFSQRARGASSQESSPSESSGLKDRVRSATQNLEKSIIIDMLKSTHGNVTHAAKKLEISRKSLQNKMKEFAIRETLKPTSAP